MTAVAAGKGLWVPQSDSTSPFLLPSQFLWGLSVYLRFNFCGLLGAFSPSLTLICSGLLSLVGLPLSASVGVL